MHVANAFFPSELRSLQQFDKRVADFLIVVLSEFSAELEKDAKSHGVSVQEFFEVREDDYFEIAEEYPQILRRSLFLLAYSRFERHLQTNCDDLRKMASVDLNSRDLNGRGIARSAKYLKRVLKLEFPDTVAEWSLIKDMARLRNHIAHNDESFDRLSEEELDKLIGSLSHVSRNRSGRIQLDEQFVQYAAGTLLRFANKFHGAVDEWMTALKRFQPPPSAG